MPKATITAVVNQKGGTAKTTTSENLGFGLAREGKKVLLVDTDPQASLTIALGNHRPDDLLVTITDLMKKIIDEEPIAPGEGILHHPEGGGSGSCQHRAFRNGGIAGQHHEP